MAGPAIGSALTQLFQAVKATFETLGIDATVYLGLKYRDLWDTSRVVIIDGEFDGDNSPKVRSAGSFNPPGHAKSYNPRELFLWERPITLSIRAVDPKNIDSEQAQIEATETLIEQTIQAVWNAMGSTDPNTARPQGLGQANLDFSSSKAVWCDPGSATQQTWGKEFLITFIYRNVIFDAASIVQTVVPVLEKGPLLANMLAGVNAKILSKAGSSAVVGNLGFCSPAQEGMSMVLSGAASGGNNGTFLVVKCLSSTSMVITNAAAVAPDAHNGAITWALAPPQ